MVKGGVVRKQKKASAEPKEPPVLRAPSAFGRARGGRGSATCQPHMAHRRSGSVTVERMCAPPAPGAALMPPVVPSAEAAGARVATSLVLAVETSMLAEGAAPEDAIMQHREEPAPTV